MKKYSVTAAASSLCEKMPRASDRSLARVLMTELPHLNFDCCRNLIRAYRGKLSTCKVAKNKIFPKIEFPVSYAQDYVPYIFEENKVLRILVLADIHIPFHDGRALVAAIEYGQDYDPTHILLNGDLMDCYQLSKHEKDPRERSAKQELDAVRQFLDILKERFPDAKIIYKEGNHEERFSSYMRNKAPELLDIDEFRLPYLLDLKGRDIDWIGEKRFINVGKMHIVHGHELQQGIMAPVNVARGLFLKTKEICMCSHSHQTSEHTEKTLSGKIITTWSTGSLCGLHPLYARSNKWNHGFATINVQKDNNFTVKNLKIINGSVY